jgi:hypothetical protein
VELVVVAAVAARAAGDLKRGNSPHFFELRDDVNRCGVTGF